MKKRLKLSAFAKKMTGDFMLNFAASAMVTGVLQIILYPIINRVIGNFAYGNFLTIIGLINTISAVIGTTLNNVRLIRENLYKTQNIKGDFNLLLIIFSIIALLVSTITLPHIFGLSYYKSALIGILIALMSFRSYWIVTYRIDLKYRNILWANVWLAVGYLLGCCVLYITAEWLIPLILGEIFCLGYIYFTSGIIKEPYQFTHLKVLILKDFGLLALTTLSANLLVYLDRLLLYPLLGAESVTTYTVAALGGKYLGIVVTPMAGVLLSYYSQKKFIMTRKKFWSISLGCIFISFLSLIVIVPIAPLIAEVLYPDAYRDALGIMFYANFAGILVVISNFIQPALLKFAPAKWQVIKEIVYGILYISLGIVMLSKYGLTGFCFANIIAVSVKIILMLLVGHIYCASNVNE